MQSPFFSITSVRLFFAALFLLGAAPLCEAQAFKTYLQIKKADGTFLEGEVLSADYLKWIEAETISFGIMNPTSLAAGGIQSGKSAPSDLVLTNVVVSNVAIGHSSSSNSPPSESIQVSYEEIKMQYFLFDNMGKSAGPPVTTSWNFATNSAP